VHCGDHAMRPMRPRVSPSTGSRRITKVEPTKSSGVIPNEWKRRTLVAQAAGLYKLPRSIVNPSAWVLASRMSNVNAGAAFRVVRLAGHDSHKHRPTSPERLSLAADESHVPLSHTSTVSSAFAIPALDCYKHSSRRDRPEGCHALVTPVRRIRF
jgi:hypothetical protein